MLYWLAELSDGGDFFNLFRYITFRAGAAFFTALIFGFLFGRPLINLLKRRQKNGQPIRADGPEGHVLTKAGTPTMGGALILGAITVSTLLWARLDNGFVLVVLGVTLSYGLIGFADDYSKIAKNDNYSGLSGKLRLTLEGIIALAASYVIMTLHPAELTGQLAFPVFKDLLLNLGLFFLPVAAFVMVGAANAVNLTDGLDGLAIMPVMIAAGTLGAIAYAVGRVDFTEYLDVHYVPGTGELLVFAAGLSVVQRATCGGVHGRHRIARARWRAWGHRRVDEARTGAGHRRGPVRSRGAVGHHSGALFQAHRETGVPDGADPSPFRKTRLGRTSDRDPVLDHLADPRAGGAGDAEAALGDQTQGRCGSCRVRVRLDQSGIDQGLQVLLMPPDQFLDERTLFDDRARGP